MLMTNWTFEIITGGADLVCAAGAPTGAGSAS